MYSQFCFSVVLWAVEGIIMCCHPWAEFEDKKKPANREKSLEKTSKNNKKRKNK